MGRYDLVKELTVALGALFVVIIVLAAVLSSPDVPSVTIQSWSKADPVDFVTTAASELAGQSTSAQYGPPYNQNNGSVQSWGPFAPQAWAGTWVHLNPPVDFVLQPLSQTSAGDPQLTDALSSYSSAGSDQQQKWITAYSNALAKASIANNAVTVPAGNYGPVPILMDQELKLAQSGGLDALLLTSHHFYQTDYSKPLLFMADGGYLPGLAQTQKMTGSQWGMMNETGRYPGQAWLWLYTMWYQIPPFTSHSGVLGISSANADLAVVGIMAILTLALLFLPYIPGLRDIPRWIPLHRLIWRRYYRDRSVP
jgi:hypothetical protein